MEVCIKSKIGVLDYLDDLKALDFMRDARIVCQDGVMLWSALLLSHWSDTAKDNLSQYGHFNVDSPLTILCPGIQIETIRKLLTWTMQGQVQVNALESVEMSTLLMSLRAQFGFSCEPSSAAPRDVSDANGESPEDADAAMLSDLENGEYNSLDDELDLLMSKMSPEKHVKVLKKGEKSKNPTNMEVKALIENAEHKPKSNISQVPQTNRKRSKRGRPRTRARFEGSIVPPPAKKEKGCPMCPSRFVRRSEVLDHLCLEHFKDELLPHWGPDHAKACSLCGKQFPPSSTCHQNRREIVRRMCRHVGLGHGFLFSMKDLNAKVKTFLEENSTLVEHWNGVNAFFKKLNQDCKGCVQGFRDSDTLVSHLACFHHSEGFMKSFDFVRSACRTCDKAVNLSEGSYGAVYHFTREHMNLFYALLTKSEREVVRRCLQLPAPNDRSGGTQPKNTANPCPLCGRHFMYVKTLKKHLCLVHYPQELLRLDPCGGRKNCKRDYRNWKEGQGDTRAKSGSQRKIAMIQHVGIIHRQLEEVLPVQVRQQVAKMEAAEERRAKSLNTAPKKRGRPARIPKEEGNVVAPKVRKNEGGVNKETEDAQNEVDLVDLEQEEVDGNRNAVQGKNEKIVESSQLGDHKSIHGFFSS